MPRRPLAEILSDDVPLRELASATEAELQEVCVSAKDIFKARFRSWSLGVGSHLLPNGTRVTWLGEKLTDDKWGMGCGICASFALRMAGLQPSGSKRRRRTYSTKWSRYQVTSAKCTQACALRKHSLSELHMAAVKAWQLPLSCVTLTYDTCNDAKLLAGAVPQPTDWLHAWSVTRNSLSNRCASRLDFTDQFICSMRIDVQAVERRAFAQMQIVMQESIRRKKRCHLSRANSITLSVDDKKPYRLVRYKACDTDGKIESGLLCVLCPLKVLMECDPEEWDEDKCVMAADSIADGIRGFCTPLGEGCNEILYSHIICNVRAFTADGAPYAQKTGRVLKDRHCRNIVLIFRDACHMIRLACRDPLLCGEAYKKAWETLFGDKCLMPQLQYSPEWRARLSMLQHLLLADDTLGGILKSKLKHMSFAAQRWESSSTPQRNLAAC